MKPILFLIFILGVVGLLYGLSSAFVEKDQASIIHSYSLSNGTELVVNNWNCGPSCTPQTTIYLRKYYYRKFNLSQAILSCDYVTDIELTDITETSAKIETLTHTTEDLDPLCPYHQGDTIHF